MKRARSIRLQPKLLLGLVAMAAVLAAILAPRSLSCTGRGWRSNTPLSRSVRPPWRRISSTETAWSNTTGPARRDAYYEEIHRYLQDVREKLGLKYFYVVVPEDEVMYYIWDAGVPGEDGVCDPRRHRRLLRRRQRADARCLRRRRGADHPHHQQRGVRLSGVGLRRHLNKAGTPVALASVDISMDMIDQQIRQFLGLTLCVVLAVLLLSIFAYYYYVRRILIRPLRTLHHAAIGLVESRMEDLFSLPGGGQHRRRVGGACPFVPVHGVGAE